MLPAIFYAKCYTNAKYKQNKHKDFSMISSNESTIPESRAAAERLMRSSVTVEEIIDDSGDARELFTLPTGDQIIFRGRDDVYLPPIQTDKAPSVLTIDEEGHTTATSFEAPGHREPAPIGENLFIANATPIGIIDLTLTLSEPGRSIDDLTKLRTNIANREFGQKEHALLDLMAAAVYDPDSYAQPGAPHLEGLLSVAQALTGDQEKTRILHEKLAVLEQAEHSLATTELGDLALEKSLSYEKAISPEALESAKGIILVRATSFDPEISADGSVALQSVSDYTHDIKHDGEGYAFLPRETIHFSLNHYVESHMGGDFSSRQYTIVSPLDKALEANGKPARMADVDTYFLTGPNEKVVLPDSIIISPDEHQSEILRRENNRIFFKSKGLGESDASKIITAYANGDFSNNPDAESLPHTFFAEKQLTERLFRFAEEQAMFIDESDSYIIKFAIDQGTMPDWRLAPPLDREKAQDMNFAELANYVAARQFGDSEPVGHDLPLSSILSALATEGAIMDQGGELVQGGMHYTSSSDLQRRVRELSDQIDVEGGLHSNTVEQTAENTALQQLYSQSPRGPHDITVNQVISNPILPHNIRRSYIANGLLVTSGKQAPIYTDEWGGI